MDSETLRKEAAECLDNAALMCHRAEDKLTRANENNLALSCQNFKHEARAMRDVLRGRVTHVRAAAD